MDEYGDPIQPSVALAKYRTVLGALVRDFIPIKYRRWNGKPWRVPESEKDSIWDNKIPQYFTFPAEYDKELVKKSKRNSNTTGS